MPLSWLGSFLWHPGPLPVGAKAPRLSLTSDEGAWVRSDDARGRRALVVLFTQTAGGRDPSAAWQEYDAARSQIEAHGATIVAVCQDRPDRLRPLKAKAGVGIPVLYDVLGWTARAYHQAGRRPYVRDGVVVIGADGTIVLHHRGPGGVAAVLGALDSQPVQSDRAAAKGPTPLPWEKANELLSRGHLLVDVRTRGEYESLHAPGAVWIPVEELPHRHGEIGQTRAVLCVCQTGGRASAAAAFLDSLGYTEVYTVTGGMSAWPGATG